MKEAQEEALRQLDRVEEQKAIVLKGQPPYVKFEHERH
jgi:hypothetical protein